MQIGQAGLKKESTGNGQSILLSLDSRPQVHRSPPGYSLSRSRCSVRQKTKDPWEYEGGIRK